VRCGTNRGDRQREQRHKRYEHEADGLRHGRGTPFFDF
jgi:hypothetical protein